jgi:hypothetical protein
MLRAQTPLLLTVVALLRSTLMLRAVAGILGLHWVARTGRSVALQSWFRECRAKFIQTR